MKKSQIIRAWRDEEYYRSLSEAERAQVPVHPAGTMEVDDEILNSITGGCGYTFKNCGCTGELTYSASCTPCPPCECF